MEWLPYQPSLPVVYVCTFDTTQTVQDEIYLLTSWNIFGHQYFILSRKYVRWVPGFSSASALVFLEPGQ